MFSFSFRTVGRCSDVLVVCGLGKKGFKASEIGKPGRGIGVILYGDKWRQTKAKGSAFGRVLPHLTLFFSLDIYLASLVLMVFIWIN